MREHPGGLYPREAVRFRPWGLERGGEDHLVGSLADLVGLVGVVLHYNEPWVGIQVSTFLYGIWLLSRAFTLSPVRTARPRIRWVDALRRTCEYNANQADQSP